MENENMQDQETQEQTENPLDALEAQVNGLIDESNPNEDNTDDSAAANAEEALADMRARLDDLETTNTRLTDLVGKMLTVYGARLNNDNSQGVEAFPQAASTVEKQFGVSTDHIPNLGEIVLGS